MAKQTRITIPYHYQERSYQIPFWQAMRTKRRAVLVWHRRAGKDLTVLNYTIDQAINERVGTYYHCFPEYGQGRKILWDGRNKDGWAFTDYFPPQIVKARNATEMKITLVNGSIWQIVGADNYNSVVGANPVGIVFSEWAVSDKYPDAWSYFRPMLAENNGWAVFPYTPRGRNHGFTLYSMALKNPEWFCQVLSVEDTGVISRADVDAERSAGMSEDMIQQEFYCSFLAPTENLLIPYDLIQSAIGRDVSYPHAPKIAGLDVARFGDDRCALVVRQGGQVIHIESWGNLDTVATAGRVLERYEARLFDVVAVDSIGVGAGVADILKNSGIPTAAVNVSESPSLNDARFNRLRDELWWRLREWFEDRSCGISRGIMPARVNEMIADIQDIRYGYTPAGKIKIESKDEMKERLHFSPDVGDALCLSFAAERLARKPVQQQVMRRRQAVGAMLGEDRPGARRGEYEYREYYAQ